MRTSKRNAVFRHEELVICMKTVNRVDCQEAVIALIGCLRSRSRGPPHVVFNTVYCHVGRSTEELMI